MRKNQKGFAGLEVLIVVAVVAVLGFAGYRYYSTRNAKTVTVNREVGKKCVEADGFCHITEWGVKFKTARKDVIYSVSQNSAEQFDAGFSSARASKFKDCDPEHDPVYGSISRFEKGAILPVPSDTEYRAGENSDEVATKVGNFYYMYFGPQDLCSEDAQKAGAIPEGEGVFLFRDQPPAIVAE